MGGCERLCERGNWRLVNICRRERLELEDNFKVKKSHGTNRLSSGSVTGQLDELGLINGRQVPAAKVISQGVVKARNVNGGDLEIVERTQKPDLTQVKWHTECS